jgi:hypothetical protein
MAVPGLDPGISPAIHERKRMGIRVEPKTNAAAPPHDFALRRMN